MEVKEVVKGLLANGAKRIDGVRVKNVTITVTDTYTRAALTLAKPVEGYIENRETGEYEKGETNVIFTSLYSLTSILKENEDVSFAANHIIENPKTLNVLLSGASVDIVQEPIAEGQVRKNPWSTRKDVEEVTFDHDTIINHVVNIEISAFGIKQLDKLAEKLMGF